MEKKYYFGIKQIFEYLDKDINKDYDKEEEEELEYHKIKFDLDIKRAEKTFMSMIKINDEDLYKEEIKYYNEFFDNLNLKEKENKLKFDNEKSFTKEIDQNIRKEFKERIHSIPLSDSNLNILMITEKPSIAYTISRILSNEKCNIHSEESIHIYTFRGTFKLVKANFTVTSVKGHIYKNDYEVKFNKNYPEESYEYNIIKILKDDSLNIPNFLRNISKNKDILCLWVDCDPEGENICYEIIHNVLPNLNKRNFQQVYRAKFSSLTELDIKLAFYRLKEYPDCQLSMSVDARSIIDYKVGVSFTNLFTSEIYKYFDEEYEEKRILSYGPCQTPTLWFCVERKKAIDNFIPSKFYKIYIEILTENNEIQKIFMDADVDSYDLANQIVSNLKLNLWATVEKIMTRKIKEDSPEGLKTTTMLKIACSEMKVSPKDISDYAQQLYMKGYISYPRTGTTKYSKNFNFFQNLNIFKYDSTFGKDVIKLSQNFKKDNIFYIKGSRKRWA